VKKLLYSLSIVFSIILYTSSCTKIRTTELGVDLIPAVDNMSVFDTTLEITTELYSLPDSTRILYSADHAIGIMEDPSFGTTNAEAYVQMQPQLFGSYPFGSSRDSILGLDSLILSLHYTSLYGDSNAVQSLKVYEIDQASDFRDSSLGYLISHPPFQVSGLVGQKDNLLFSTLNDSIAYLKVKDTVKTVNELRIPISNSLGLKLMNLDTTYYKSDTLFNSQFKGFAIRPDAGSALKRALAYVNFYNAGTRLRFHYRKIKNGVADTTTTDFIFRNYANANLVNRDISGSPYASKLQNGASNQEELYLQSSPGSYALLKIPGLASLSNRLIYKASLIADRLPGVEDNYFTEPSLLFLDAIDSANNRYYTIPNSFIRDDNSGLGYTPSVFGGYLKTDKYEFDLARYVQGIVSNGQTSYSLRLYAPYITIPTLAGTTDITRVLRLNPPIASGRVIVGGGAHATKKLRLYIIYSKI
jgi:hypothetical protein